MSDVKVNFILFVGLVGYLILDVVLILTAEWKRRHGS